MAVALALLELVDRNFLDRFPFIARRPGMPRLRVSEDGAKMIATGESVGFQLSERAIAPVGGDLVGSRFQTAVNRASDNCGGHDGDRRNDQERKGLRVELKRSEALERED